MRMTGTLLRGDPSNHDDPDTNASSIDENAGASVARIKSPIGRLMNQTTAAVYAKLSDFLQGPGLALLPTALNEEEEDDDDDKSSATLDTATTVVTDATDAVSCASTHHPPKTMHFPHAMQQFYGCVSWWSAHPSKTPVLVMDIRTYVIEIYRRWFKPNSFLDGFLRALRSDLGVRLRVVVVATPFSSSSSWLSGAAAVAATTSAAAAASSAVQVKELGDPNTDGVYAILPRHVYALRNKIIHRMQAKFTNENTNNNDQDMPSTSSSCQASPRVGITNRRQHKRTIRNLVPLVDALQKGIDDASNNKSDKPTTATTIRVTDFDTATFEQQVSFFADTDIIITPHGAQLTGLPFLGANAVTTGGGGRGSTCGCCAVLVLFPAGYLCPEYFGSLAASAGIAHYWMYLSDGNATAECAEGMKTKRSRQEHRHVDICPPIDPIVRATQEIVRGSRTTSAVEFVFYNIPPELTVVDQFPSNPQ